MIVLGKRFFQVSGVRFKQQFQWPLWFLFQTKGSNLVQGYRCLLPASSFVLLGISLSLPRVWLCPLLGQQHLSSVTLRSAVLTGDFFFPPLLISHFLCCAWSFFLLMTLLMSLSFLCLIYASVFLPYQTLYSLLYLPSLSVFCPVMSFLSFLFPFVYLLLTSLFFPLCVILFIPSPVLSFLTLCLPLDVFSPSCSFGHCPFPRLRLHIFYLNITYECVYIYLHIFHSPAETKKLLMLIVRFYFIPFSAPEIHCSCSSSDIYIG